MAKSLDDLKGDIEALRQQYTDLTSRPAALFNVSNITDAQAAVDALTTQIEKAEKQAADLEAGFGGIYKTIQGIVSELKKGNEPINLATRAFKNIQETTQKLYLNQAGVNRLSSDELKSLKVKLEAQQTIARTQAAQLVEQKQSLLNDRNGNALQGAALSQRLNSLIAAEDLTEQEAAMIRAAKEGFSVFEETNEKLKEALELREKEEEEVRKILGLSGALLGTLGKIPVIGESAAKAYAKIKKEIEDAQAAGQELPTKMQVFGKVLKETGKGVVQNLKDPLVIVGGLVTALVKTFKDVDKGAEDTARGMNMSYSEAVKFRTELIGAAFASNSQYVTSKGLLETNLAINSALGTSVKLTDANAQEFTKLRVTAGLTNEELIGINSLSITNGKTLEQNTGEIMAQAKMTGLRRGVLLNEKEILKSIKDVSAATTLTLGKNPKLIAEAAATAKSLGMEMSQIENISNSLLDFQSSIENELSAELLTGKQLNLETARYAALTGDVATVASEVAAQLGSAAEFGEMNRLQQDAIAKSVGMNREELAKTLYVQEQLKGVSGDQAKAQEALINKRIEEVGLAQAQQELAEKGVEGLEEQAGIATQFNVIVEKLQENFVLVADAVMPFFNAIAGVFGFLSKIPGLMPAILAGLVAMKTISAVVAAKEFAVATAKIFGTFAGIPFGLGIPLAIGAVAGLTGLIASFTADDLFSPGQGGSGYGKRTLLAPEGAYKLNDNDNIIATTNPINVNDMISGPKGSIRPQAQTTQSQPTKSEISIAPGNTQINLNLNGAAIGNANARQDYGVGRGAKAFGGAVDYSAPI